MKWPGREQVKRKRSVVAKLVMTALLIATLPGPNAFAGSNQKPVDLDDIQLDEKPAPPKTKSVSKNPKRKTASVADVELDDEAAPSTAVAASIAKPEKIPDNIKLLLAAADLHEKDHDYKSVITTLKSKLDQLPRSGLLQLGRAYAAEKDTLGEIHAIELVTAKNPKDYVAQTELGNAYVKVKRYDDAATVFSAARDLNPKYRPAYLGALSILEALQETYEARTLVTDIVRIFGADAKTTSDLCRMYSGEGFVPEKSEDACRAAIAKDPKNPQNYVFLTMALTNTDQKEVADLAIVDAAKRFPASEEVQNLAGSMKIDDKSFADSYRYFTAAVKAAPASAKAWVGLAKSAFELQKHGEAIDDFTKACKLDRKTTLDFRQASIQLKRNKDPKWMKYQDAIDDRCD